MGEISSYPVLDANWTSDIVIVTKLFQLFLRVFYITVLGYNRVEGHAETQCKTGGHNLTIAFSHEGALNSLMLDKVK